VLSSGSIQDSTYTFGSPTILDASGKKNRNLGFAGSVKHGYQMSASPELKH